uniref:Uncharacterized protein n=1 Tax=Arundo donax TaxID=35708 RepID=A0A0A9ESY0_ARUDO
MMYSAYMKSQLKFPMHTERIPTSAATLHAMGTTSETTRSALMELSHSASALRFDSRGTTAVSRYFSRVARGSTVSGSAWTAPQSRTTLRMRRSGDRTSAVKTNSGTAVATCTSCPAATRCRTTSMARVAWPKPWPVR